MSTYEEKFDKALAGLVVFANKNGRCLDARHDQLQASHQLGPDMSQAEKSYLSGLGWEYYGGELWTFDL